MTGSDDQPAARAFEAWATLGAAIAATTPAELQDLAESVVRSALDPTEATVPHSATAAFGEQIVVDVSAVDDPLRTAALAELGAAAPGYVLAIWFHDMATRSARAFEKLLGAQPEPPAEPEPRSAPAPLDAWAAHEEFLLEVARLGALDPVTSELVRLRGARAHACRLCQSRRNVAAIDLAGRADLFDESDPTDLTTEQRLALRVVDTFVWTPLHWPSDLGTDVVRALGPSAAVELILDIVRNSANKLAVAFAADAPQVASGVEYYEIDPVTGQLRYDVAPLGLGR